jgi:hypothetical protein
MFRNEEYVSATASTIEGAQRLVEAGFEYVTDINGVKLFRKRKVNRHCLLSVCVS